MIITTDSLPTTCEFCGTELVWDGVNLICPNKNCSNIIDEKLKAWVINIAPVDGIGWKTFKKLLDDTDWNIKTVADLYIYAQDKRYRWQNVKENSEKDLFNKTLDKLCNEITISQFLLALKIPGLGKIGAKAVENSEAAKIAFENVLCCKYNTKSLNFEYDLCGKQNIWAKLLQDVNVAESIYTKYRDYFINCYNLVKDQIYFDGYTADNNVQKGTVVITGTLSKKRDDFIKQLKEAGWKVTNKITKDTAYLITNTPESGTTKNKEADRLGVKKITETAFMNFI